MHVGTIELRSKSHGVQARGEINDDGSFELSTYRAGDGAAAGEHEVVIVQFIVAEQVRQHSHGSLGIVHPKFASYETSQLICSIPKGGTNQLEIVVSGVDATGDGGADSSGPVE